ncbi:MULTISPECIES: MFS transporter [Acinetobacter]|uniref:MFS transporter n=1 Tax=Acinetobacter indicus TaxID=756892 RepID=A0A7S6VN64_9GAMM|nr:MULTISPECIES: MFS transporter [Acinetobacter]MCP0916796.1 MFS transporter [Acinetobacter indicus]MCP0919909.1 MFS transporter [Acinetobacter indicus]MCP0922576.1 MFS transporter [Acinetobacter indicus]MDM1271305.1 MFS transporter [Acinetobacter indicus]MDM1274694.1 MFS transporter [Acinetobacter indicus]
MSSPTATPVLSPQFVLLMALACGLCAGSAYFNQPLIYSIEKSLGISTSQAGFAVVVAQIGYGLGLMLLVPLGDLLNKRKLIVSLMVFAAISQILLSLSSSLSGLYFFTLCATFGAISAQVLIPFASTISPPESSAAIVGKLMSGLVMGIILSRTFAGFVSTYWSWEGVYLSSGILTLGFALLMWHKLPNTEPQSGLTVMGIYRSLFKLAQHHPHLIRRACAGALGFGILSMVFTSMTFVLGSAPYHFSDFEIGLFGLLGVIGIYSASWSGKTVGQGKENLVATLCISLMLLSCIPLFFAQQNIVVYAIGVLMSYFGLTAFHVLNQNLVYRIDIKARSRINAVYMTIYFSGAAIGSLGAVYAWEHFEWIGCVALGLVFALGILVIDRFDFKKMKQA